MGFLPGGRTWRGPPRHGLLRHPTRLPARAGVGQRLGRWSVSSGRSSATAAFSQPQQHGGSGHTELAPDAEPGRERGRARTLGFSAGGRGKEGGLSRFEGAGPGVDHAPKWAGLRTIGMPAAREKIG